MGAPTVVQHKTNTSTANAVTVAVTITANAKGNLLVVGGGNKGTRTVTGVADNATGGNNVYVQATNAGSPDAGDGTDTDIWHCLTAPRAGAVTVTITFSGSAGTFQKFGEVWEVSASTVALFDIANNLTGTSVPATITGASVTSGYPVGFIAALLWNNNGITNNPSTGNEFTAGGDTGGNTFGGVSLLSTSAGVHTPAWDVSGGSVPFTTSTASYGFPVEIGWKSPTAGPSYAI